MSITNLGMGSGSTRTRRPTPETAVKLCRDIYPCRLIWLVASADIWLLKTQSNRDWGKKDDGVKQVSGTAWKQRV